MSELHATQVTAEEASRRIAADIRAYPLNGPDKREEHLRLFGALLSREDIEGAWADRYAEIAKAKKSEKPALTYRRIVPTNASSFYLPLNLRLRKSERTSKKNLRLRRRKKRTKWSRSSWKRSRLALAL
jgi:hypothetical protein